MIEVRRGDLVLVAFPFVGGGGVGRKRRPAVVVQSDSHNRRRGEILTLIDRALEDAPGLSGPAPN